MEPTGMAECHLPARRQGALAELKWRKPRQTAYGWVTALLAELRGSSAQVARSIRRQDAGQCPAKPACPRRWNPVPVLEQEIARQEA